MANPRQRRKVRSSSYRPVKTTATKNKMPVIRGPKVLQDAWDRKKTVKQNYAALGLAFGLTPYASGGIEKQNDSPDTSGAEASSSQHTLDGPAPLPAGRGRILRDEEGNIIGIEMPEDPEDPVHETEPPVSQDMDALEPQVEQDTLDKWVSHLGHNTQDVDLDSHEATKVVKELERISTKQSSTGNTLSLSYSGVGARHASQGERAYLQRLVDRHGDDVEKMAMDRRLNPEQRTIGQLRKALKRAGFT